MAQSRLITSDIWADDWFGPLPFFDQALWIGLFSQCADDQGRLLDNPILIRAAVFPYKDTAVLDIDAALARFAEAGKLIRYQADGKRLIQIVNWWEHQRPQWAQPSKWPAPEGWRDAVRTRQNGEYLADNWTGARGLQVVPSGEPTTLYPHAGAHIPDPDPVPDPVEVPDPDPTPVEVEEADPARAGARRADAAPAPSSPTPQLTGAEADIYALATRTFDARNINAETPGVIRDLIGLYGSEWVVEAIQQMDVAGPQNRGWAYVTGILDNWQLDKERRAASPDPPSTAPPGGNGHAAKPWKMAMVERRAGRATA